MDSYRYGFQNQEKDDEIKGAGNSVNYTFRMHDPRVGRFFAVDPLVKSYPELTSYQFSSNSPIFMVELEGKEGKITVTTKWYTDKGIQKSKSKTYTVEGLKADIIKICWKGYNNGAGPVVEIDYFGRAEDGTRLGGLTHVNPDAKPSVKELNAIFANDAMNSYNVKEKEKEAAIAKKENENWYDGTILASGALSGDYDGADGGGEYAGLKNMYKAADGLDKIGDKLSYVPTPVTQAGGEVFSGAADILRTIADYNTLDGVTATKNLIKRGASFIITKKLDRIVDDSGLSKNDKHVGKQINRKSSDLIKDEITTKPK